MRGDDVRLEDILDSIAAIERYALHGREMFDADPLVQTWFLHHVQIVGEAARAPTPGLKARHPEVPWKKINGMRNIVVHYYHGISMGKVWTVAIRHLPVLKVQIEAILAQMRGDP